ncbi:MAG: hypothetical protein HY867_21085 [Chloroflexi bacterium]|nr:hypothetical protein [Chloroflexota bacterium]
MNFRLKFSALLSLLILLLLASRTLVSAQPFRAVSLLEGRSYDQAHDSGFIDWQGPVRYVNLAHKDGASLPPREDSHEYVVCLEQGNPGYRETTFDGRYAAIGILPPVLAAVARPMPDNGIMGN